MRTRESTRRRQNISIVAKLSIGGLVRIIVDDCRDGFPRNEAIPAIALHLHAYFLRLPAKQLLFNYCPQMPTYEADNCMQNTASITAQYG